MLIPKATPTPTISPAENIIIVTPEVEAPYRLWILVEDEKGEPVLATLD